MRTSQLRWLPTGRGDPFPGVLGHLSVTNFDTVPAQTGIRP